MSEIETVSRVTSNVSLTVAPGACLATLVSPSWTVRNPVRCAAAERCTPTFQCSMVVVGPPPTCSSGAIRLSEPNRNQDSLE